MGSGEVGKWGSGEMGKWGVGCGKHPTEKLGLNDQVGSNTAIR